MAYENCSPEWSIGRLLSHLAKLKLLSKLHPEDGSIEIEARECSGLIMMRM